MGQMLCIDALSVIGDGKRYVVTGNPADVTC